MERIFNSSCICTTDNKLVEGNIYQYKESLPTDLLSFRLNKIELGGVHGEDWVTLHIKVLNSIYKENIGKETTFEFRNGEKAYYAGMWRIYDDGTYFISEAPNA